MSEVTSPQGQASNAATRAPALSAASRTASSNSRAKSPTVRNRISGSAAAVKLLLDRGAQINAKESVHGQTALMFAAALNRADAVKLLRSIELGQVSR